MKKCAVIGSINMDMMVSAPRFPRAGETLTGSAFSTMPGGKGANQAAALARLGVEVKMAGRVGDDAFGRQYLKRFEELGADASAVEVAPGESTGVADILVSASGENCIVVVPGANAGCDADWLGRTLARVMDCEIFLLQLEIPLETVTLCAERLRAAGRTVILDPAPAAALPEKLLRCADYITPNETELEALTGFLPAGAGMEARVAALAERTGGTVVHKRGALGAFVGGRDGIVRVPGYSVDAVDTTAAGDTFNAGFAAGLAQGLDLLQAVKLGNAAGALAITAFGAQEGMPDLQQVRALMAAQDC